MNVYKSGLIASAVMTLTLLGGCASSSHQHSDVQAAKQAADAANAKAAQALEAARAADAKAQQALDRANEVDAKVDRIFNKSMMK